MVLCVNVMHILFVKQHCYRYNKKKFLFHNLKYILFQEGHITQEAYTYVGTDKQNKNILACDKQNQNKTGKCKQTNTS